MRFSLPILDYEMNILVRALEEKHKDIREAKEALESLKAKVKFKEEVIEAYEEEYKEIQAEIDAKPKTNMWI